MKKRTTAGRSEDKLFAYLVYQVYRRFWLPIPIGIPTETGFVYRSVLPTCQTYLHPPSHPYQEAQLKGQEEGRESPNHSKSKCPLALAVNKIDRQVFFAIEEECTNRARRKGATDAVDGLNRSSTIDRPWCPSGNRDTFRRNAQTGATSDGKLSRYQISGLLCWLRPWGNSGLVTRETTIWN